MFTKLILFLLFPACLFAQTLPDSTAKKIDRIFSNYNSKTPGAAVAVIQNGQMVFKTGYGTANLEYDIPITSSTIFHIASLSKQVVAFSILLLEKEGKLSLTDDIRKYLDYVPDFGKKITIQHLINHTSGLRDQWQLLAIAGWQLDDVITQDQVIKLVSTQKELNFNPGEQYMYCNTGYTLLGEIVKKISGLSLREYCNKNIFLPLGMSNTHFHDNYQELVKNRAYSYYPGPKNVFRHSVLSYSTVGATSLFTTVEDEAKWLLNFETGQVGGKDLINKMFLTGVLNDNKKLDYAFGLAVNEYKGYKQISHGGADAGYRTYLSYYPEAKTGIIIFSNLATISTGFLNSLIADVLLPKKELAIKEEKREKADSTILKKMVGDYYAYNGERIGFSFSKGKFLVTINSQPNTASNQTLFKVDDNTYEITGLTFHFTDLNGKEMVNEFVIETANGRQTYYRQPKVEVALNPKEYAGKYYNDETESYYSIEQVKDTLTLQHRKHPDFKLIRIAPDQFKNDTWWMDHIRFIRNKKGIVTGFEVNSGRVQHLLFRKIK